MYQPGASDVQMRDAATSTAEELGPCVFVAVRDTLGLAPKYSPHRNVDAVRIANIMSRMIKEGLCKRAKNAEGRLVWRFLDNGAYHRGMDSIGDEEYSCMLCGQ